MPFSIDPTWLVAGIVAVVLLLVLITRIPVIGTAIRAIVSLALIAAVGFVLVERAAIDPYLGKLASRPAGRRAARPPRARRC